MKTLPLLLGPPNNNSAVGPGVGAGGGVGDGLGVGVGEDACADKLIVFVPLVWLPTTVITPLWLPGAVGENVIVTTCEPFGAMVPLVQLAAD
jgi:hypothetical protein